MPNPRSTDLSRRDFLANTSRSLIAATLGGEILANTPTALAQQNPLELPVIQSPTEQATGNPPDPLAPEKRVGFAVVGLGHLALNQIIPAFGSAKKAKLVAVVSGSPAKAARVAQDHGLPDKNIYDYKTYDQIRDNPEVQVIYIVLPNGLHAEYTVRGAQAGKHILCEKPMANSPAEAEQMIAACKQAERQLMIAYRIQYEPNNRLMQDMVRSKKYGRVKIIESFNGQDQGDPNQWRQKKALSGGGSLPDVGLYCLNTTRFLLGEEPTEVSATIYSTPHDPRFAEVEESVLFQMRFPSGTLANCGTSYGTHECRRYRVNAENGWFGMDPAFSYENLRLEESHAAGMVEHRETPSIMPKDQFALELDHMAECVLENKQPYTPGEEGLQDQRIMAAIYASAASNRPVKIAPAGDEPGKLDQFRGAPPA